jgi:putative membrane-bound dehydrogenase-like protein
MSRILLLSFLALLPAIHAQVPDPSLRDFDRDGQPERLVHQPGRTVIQTRDPVSGIWKDSDLTLPEGISALDANGRDNGLHFLDLNGDGFDDLVLSNPDRVSIHLWSKSVQPHLGWTRGWSQFVQDGPRTREPGEPPSLVGATLRLSNGIVTVTSSGPSQSYPARDWIDVRMPPPRSPAEALASFTLPAGFAIQLVAAEPVVIDPVAFDWDADGRLWVVEMRDYPMGIDGKGKPGGVIKVLTDRDSAGRYQRAEIFLEGIPYPSGVMPWGRGVLVSAAPDLFYAEDTDADGRADVRRVLFTGFNEGNQQHRFNGFEPGLDGWIYAANGDSGGTVKSVATGRSVSISGRDLRFKPDTGELESVSAQTQFGRRRDDWGNWFGNNNPTWLWQVVLPEHYLRRNPALAVPRVLKVLANYDEPTRVFPTSSPRVRPNQPWSLNHVTSGCSPTPWRDSLFGPDFTHSVFISEPVHNCIHRETLYPDGSVLGSRRAPGEERSEFLASSDHWFRPTTTRTGPDGALYLADMYRFVLEHPEWISPEMQARMNLRAGEDRGRIYRIVPTGTPLRPIPRLSQLDTAGLVAALDSPNGWQRDTAQRLITSRKDPAAVPALTALVTPRHIPQVRIQALATLGQLKALTPALLQTALADPHPGIRSEALRQSEPFAPAPTPLLPIVIALASDSHPSVRLQAAFTLGAWPIDLIESALRELAARDARDPWIPFAIQSSLLPTHPLFLELKSRKASSSPVAVAPTLTPSSPDRAEVIAQYRSVSSLPADAARGHVHFTALCAPCHRLRGEGTEVGPDLGMTAGKPVDWLLNAILDPSQSIEARYRAWNVTTTDTQIASDLITAETANNIVLRIPGGIDQPILRSDITALEPMPQSLMPAGFESALPPAAMADLIAWIRSTDPATSEKP